MTNNLRPGQDQHLPRTRQPHASRLMAARCTLALAIFSGCVMASDTQTTPAPAKAGPEYRLGPEDVVDVFVWKEPDLSTSVVIRPDGKISLPLANELEAAGRTASELQQDITERLKRYINQPVVSVMVKQINSQKISILGEVRKPDVYKIKSRITVMDAIAMAGGFTDLARANRVVVLRNTAAGQERIKVDLKQQVADTQGTPFYLQALDTVYVEGR